MKTLIEHWEAALKLHTSHPSSFLILLAGLTFVALAFEVEHPIASAINALLAGLVIYLYVDMLMFEVYTRRDLRQKSIDSLDD